MRKKKFVILGILFCMAVVCLLAPRLWGVSCPVPTPTTTTAATPEEVLSEFDPALPLGFDNFYLGDAASRIGFIGADILETPQEIESGKEGPAAICDLPHIFMDLDLGAKATIPNEAELLERAELGARVRLGNVYRSIRESQERYDVSYDPYDLHQRALARKEALELLGVGSIEELTSIILEQLRDPDSSLNKPGPIEMGPEGMIEIEPQPAQSATEVESVVDHLQPFVLGGPTSETIEADIAWKKALDKAREADNKAREAREAAKKLSEALNNAMDAEPGSDEARKAGEEVSKAAKKAKETGKEADKASKEAEKARKEAGKASDAAIKEDDTPILIDDGPGAGVIDFHPTESETESKFEPAVKPRRTPFALEEGPASKAFKKAFHKYLWVVVKYNELLDAEERAKMAAEKLGKALNDAMDTEPGEEARKAAEKVGEAAEEAKETAQDAEKAKKEYKEASEEYEKAAEEYEKATDKAYEEAEKQNEAAREAAEKAYEATGHGTGKANKE